MVTVKMPVRIKPSFRRYIGIDYSGTKIPDDSLKGLRVYEASREFLPVEVGTAAQPVQVLDPARLGRVAGGTVVRGRADHRRDRPRFFLSPPLLRSCPCPGGAAGYGSHRTRRG